MGTNTQEVNSQTDDDSVDFPRRAVLMAAGASAGLTFASGTGTATGTSEADGGGGDTVPSGSIHPIFGQVSADPNPCGGNASEDCFEEFPPDVRPSHEIEARIDLPELVLALAGQGGLSDLTTGTINQEVADGEVTPRNVHRPDASVTIELPGGGTESVTVADVAEMVANTRGFFFEPTGIHVHPGDVVLVSAETPDHGVAAYHERHGRQNRVPDGVGPVASPLIPVGGYWLYRFETPGVYDFYCPPHQVFGMVLRVVVHGGSGGEPSLSIEDTGRPPDDHNSLPMILGGLDPNIPSSHSALSTDVLEPANIVDSGSVSWEEVVRDHRTT